MTQKEALDILKLGHNVFLTGSAGSGKTFLLNEYIGFLRKKSVQIGITASTGIAATHINGITIHSWAGIGIKDELVRRDLNKILKKKNLTSRFKKTKILIIDEVSMLHSFRLDMVDKVCKAFKQNTLPFGGMQVVLCGDFFQLPPVSKGKESADFIDKSQIWKNMNLKVCYLHEQYRHTDKTLTCVLNDIRGNSVGENTLVPLRNRYQKDTLKSPTITKLYTHNMDVDLINSRELSKIQGKTKEYEMSSKGNRNLAEFLKRSCLAPEKLVLKIGAVVMFVKNNFERGYTNGTLGKIISFDNNGMPKVKTFRGKNIVAVPEEWHIEEEGKIKAAVYQIPLRLAWAITVHKSQGMTLDAAEVDLSKSFTHGMGYVALSRVKSLEGLKLMGLNKIALEVNKEVLVLDKKLIEMSKITGIEFGRLDCLKREKMQNEFLFSVAPKEEEKPISTYEKTKLLAEQKLSISEIAKSRKMTEGTIVGHLEKLLESGEKIDVKYLRPTLPPERFEKIKKAFEKTKDTRLAPVKGILSNDFSYDEIRLARLFL